MLDSTEQIRRQLQSEINNSEVTAEKTWTTQELQEEFTVIGFTAPFVVVKNKLTGEEGTMMFKHSPRIYFNFQSK